MGQGTQTVATFTGTLLQRQRAEGKPFVQLVFREGSKDWLCLSTNVARVTALQIGKTYKIEGVFKALGERQYVHEPQITSVRSRLDTFRRWGLYVGIVLAVAVLTALAVRAVHGSLSPSSAETVTGHKPGSAKVTTAAKQKTDKPTDSSTPVTDAPEPAPTPIARSTSGGQPTTNSNTNTTPPPSAPTNPVTTPPPAVPKQPHCDGEVSTPPSEINVDDPTQPVGTETVVQGTPRITKTCYPDVGTANPTVTVIQEGEPTKHMIGTMPPADPDPTPPADQ